MASSTEIANLAISHLGVGKEISSLDTDRSNEGLACRRFYETARDACLRAFAWPFATKIASLGLIEEDPNSEWDFSYQYPSDCLEFRRILSGIRNDSRDTRAPYRLAYGSSGQVIFSDQADAEVEYTVKVTDPARFPPDFVMALSFLLAAYISPRILGGDNMKMGDRALQLYNYTISAAETAAANEEQPEQIPESEFIRARDGGPSDPFQTRFSPA